MYVKNIIMYLLWSSDIMKNDPEITPPEHYLTVPCHRSPSYLKKKYNVCKNKNNCDIAEY